MFNSINYIIINGSIKQLSNLEKFNLHHLNYLFFLILLFNIYKYFIWI